MHNLRLFLLCSFFCPAMVFAQAQPSPSTPSATAPVAKLPNPTTPEEFFARARQMSDLEAAGIPFHLKATYVATGDTEFTGSGTYEEWWRSKDVWRKEATLGNYRYVAIQDGQAIAASATSTYMPLRARQVMEPAISHIGLPEQQPQDWKLSQIPNGGDSVEELTKQSLCNPSDENVLCVEQYRFAENGALQSYRHDDLTKTYNRFQPFGRLSVPRSVMWMLQGEPVLTIKILFVEPLHSESRSSFDTKSIPDLGIALDSSIIHKRAYGVTPPKAIHTPAAKYPKSERERYLNKIVVIACEVDPSGAVREPYVQLSGGTAFDSAAMRAVSRYKFIPAMYQGRPTAFDINILVSFNEYR